MGSLKFTTKQLQKMGEVAGTEFRPGTPIEVEETNLHGGSTIVMRGRPRTGATDRIEILVSRNGQSSDLSKLDRGIRAVAV
jgi:hypothetical protein